MFLVVAVILAAFCILYFARARNTGHRLPLPPGPPGDWDITSLSSFISLQTLESLVEEYRPVFPKSSHCARAPKPRWTAASDGFVWDEVAFIAVWRMIEEVSKVSVTLHTHLQAKAAKDYEPLQMHYAANLVRNIAGNPAKHMDYAKEYAASFILSLAYGRTGSIVVNEPGIVAIGRSLKRVGSAVRPRAYMVDEYLPFYHRDLRSWHNEELSLYRKQIAGVEDNMGRTFFSHFSGDSINARLDYDTIQPCFTKYLLENEAKLQPNRNELAYLAGTMFGAGSTTTASAISVVIMAAASFPATQTWVQEELDTIVGHKRVPTFDDYVDLLRALAFVLESYRWRPVGGSGFAHRASRDIIWRNYCIPKDAMVIGDHWSICRDPSVFANPEVFDPTRWFDNDGSLKSDASLFNFGFGRWVCPGRHVADRSLFITTTLLL
ncbi:uncharacterized protein ARMOST_22140 [Armillaria ostoyae]|uniref:Cytochrome P450 n=1 Tax=Armillaria ostoyae TaxID=47428 RepID=A0A284SC17_ARMOS|nr:uncharacterized protein ARMOST_22140 [Armillaria ostoyae]